MPGNRTHVLAQNLVSLSTVIGAAAEPSPGLPSVRLDGGKLAKILIGAVLHQLRPDILLVDAWFMRARLVLWAVASPSLARRVSTRRSSSARGAGADGRPSTAGGSTATSS